MNCIKCGGKHYAKNLCKKCYTHEYSIKNSKKHTVRATKWTADNPQKRKHNLEKHYIKFGKIPMSINKTCSLYLGCHIAEKILKNVFKNVKTMPPNNPGYDFICNNGKKIDVKSACLCNRQDHTQSWAFIIKKNKIADYFLCVAFDNRKSLTPLHLWLIPSNEINNQTSASISKSTLSRWNKYKIDIDKTTECCNQMKLKTGEINAN